MFFRKGVLRNFAKFTSKHPCQSRLFNQLAGLQAEKKRLWHRCFPVNFATFLRTPFFTEHLQWLLLCFWKALHLRCLRGFGYAFDTSVLDYIMYLTALMIKNDGVIDLSHHSFTWEIYMSRQSKALEILVRSVLETLSSIYDWAFFARRVNSFKPLTILQKSSIIDGSHTS